MQTKLLINGALVAGEGESHAVYNPSQGNVLVRITEASGAQVQAAVQSADEAFDAWSQTPPKERAALLLKLAERIDAQAHVFARLEADNCGKPSTPCCWTNCPPYRTCSVSSPAPCAACRARRRESTSRGIPR